MQKDLFKDWNHISWIVLTKLIKKILRDYTTIAPMDEKLSYFIKGKFYSWTEGNLIYTGAMDLSRLSFNVQTPSYYLFIFLDKIS